MRSAEKLILVAVGILAFIAVVAVVGLAVLIIWMLWNKFRYGGAGDGRVARAVRTLPDLFLRLFSLDELRAFLRRFLGSEWPMLAAHLPSGITSPATLASEAAEALERRGNVQPALFDALAEERPEQEASIRAVQHELIGTQT